jgi:hypothetical protein
MSMEIGFHFQFMVEDEVVEEEPEAHSHKDCHKDLLHNGHI